MVYLFIFFCDRSKIIWDILQNVSREMRNCERVKETIKEAKSEDSRKERVAAIPQDLMKI